MGASVRDEEQRLRWLAKVACLDPGKLVFVDESGFPLAMTPSYIRAPKGERAYAQVPRDRGANTSFIAALSFIGPQAPMTPQGNVDGISLETYIEQMLVPTLTPGQIVVLDNHRIHKGDTVAELLAAHGCSMLFLPPYSPDMNPIEEALSKIKTFVKACQARAREALDQAIAAALKTITLQDILGWFGILAIIYAISDYANRCRSGKPQLDPKSALSLKRASARRSWFERSSQ